MLVQAENLPHYQRRTIVTPHPSLLEAELQQHATSKRIMDKKHDLNNIRAGVRLHLPLAQRLSKLGLSAQSIHQGGTSNGYMQNKGWFNNEVLGYALYVTLHNAYFNVSQSGREKIVSGQSKMPMASVDGYLKTLYADAAPNCDGISISFNPHSTHLFIDEFGHAIHSAEEVTIFENRAYARGKIVFYNQSTAPARAGDSPSKAIFYKP